MNANAKPSAVKTVVIDARMIGPFPHGVARYVSLLARGLGELNKEAALPYRPVFLVDSSLASQIPEGSLGGFDTLEIDSPYLRPRELWKIPRALRQLGADLYHSPSLSSLVRCPCPWISTIHDLNHLRFGSGLSGAKDRLYYRFVMRRFVRGARRILTVSEFSRDEMAPWLGVPASKVGVVYNALDPKLAEPIDESKASELLTRYGLEEGRYFFCLSNPKPHKNVALLVRAFQNARAQWPKEIKGWKLATSMPARESVPDVIWLGSLPDEDARILLSKAGALTFPSLYEGFGLPPLEAASLGVPVIVSGIPAHREALRLLRPGEVTWVAPTDEEAWAKALSLAASGNRPRPSSETRKKIFERFNPRRLGAEMDPIYRSVLGL